MFCNITNTLKAVDYVYTTNYYKTRLISIIIIYDLGRRLWRLHAICTSNEESDGNIITLLN